MNSVSLWRSTFASVVGRSFDAPVNQSGNPTATGSGTPVRRQQGSHGDDASGSVGPVPLAPDTDDRDGLVGQIGSQPTSVRDDLQGLMVEADQTLRARLPGAGGCSAASHSFSSSSSSDPSSGETCPIIRWFSQLFLGCPRQI